MANTKSAGKRIRTNGRNRIRNQGARSVLRTEMKRFRALLEAGNAATAGDGLATAHAAIDRSAKKGLIPERTASRYKSRLALAHARLVAKAGDA